MRELLEDLLPKNAHFHDFEITHTFPLLGEKTMLLNARRIIQKMNHEELILLAISDITEQATERIKIEESEIKYRTLLTSIDQGFSLCELIRNKDGKGIDVCVLEVNPTYEQQTGIKKEMMIGKNLMQVFPSSHNWIETYTAMIDNQRPVVFENYFEGTDRWFAIKAYPVEKEKFAVLFNDITSQKQASQYTRSLIEASLDPLVTISADGKITDVNEASIKVTGVEREKLIGTDFSHYFTEPQKAQEGYQQVFEKGFVADYPLTIKHINGNLTDVLYNASVYKDDKGNVLGVFAAARDITARKKAEEKIKESEVEVRKIKEQLELSITAGKIGVWHWDVKNDLLYWSNEQHEIYGFNTSETVTSSAQFNALIVSGDLKHIQDDQSAGNKLEHEYDFRINRKNDGELRWIKSRAKNTFDSQGVLQYISGVNIDITEQKLFEGKLIEAKTSAENAAKSRQQFLSSMSHEIRTPMNAIIGFTNVLLKSKVDHAQEEYLKAIKVSGDALLVLINDILDLAKVDAGKMTFEQTPFNLAASLSAMLQLFDLKMKEKNLELAEQFDAAIPEIVMGDPTRLRQIILNLISNAVKFTNAGKITMHVALLNQDAEKVTIQFKVTDTGIGIHKNKLEHIFDDFGQATYENSRLYGGTGLGLSIVRKLIDLQGGTIHVESELGIGSAFSFQLAFAKTNQKIVDETERLANKPAEIKNIKVLVAEDLTLNQLLIKLILADFGFEVDIADNGKIAIEKLQKNTYDLVLMDLQMPEMNGFDATAYVRNTMNSNIPIIALTADVTSIDVEKARAVGMDDYISKPVEEQLLYSKIIKVLQKTY